MSGWLIPTLSVVPAPSGTICLRWHYCCNVGPCRCGHCSCSQSLEALTLNRKPAYLARPFWEPYLAAFCSYCMLIAYWHGDAVIIIIYLSCSWATCWPVPVSRLQKPLQRSATIPSASHTVLFHYPGQSITRHSVYMLYSSNVSKIGVRDAV
jgi:hypothetical protein